MGNPAWVVRKVVPRKDYTLLLTFEDGKNGIYDFRPDLSRPIFRKQQNIDFFMQAKALYGTVVWPDDSDIAPEHLYEKSTSIKSRLCVAYCRQGCSLIVFHREP